MSRVHPLLEEYVSVVLKLALEQQPLVEQELLKQKCDRLRSTISDLLFAIAPAVDDIDSLE